MRHLPSLLNNTKGLESVRALHGPDGALCPPCDSFRAIYHHWERLQTDGDGALGIVEGHHKLSRPAQSSRNDPSWDCNNVISW